MNSSPAGSTMQAESLDRMPEIPPSEVEWEDLLVRLEVMTRAMGVALEGMAGEQPEAFRILQQMLERESRVRAFLEAAAGEPECTRSNGAQTAVTYGDALDLFVRARARNFAIVQRRGIDVWEWRAHFDGRPATVYQVLSLLAREDVVALAALRSIARAGTDVC